jgi:CRP/FNR family transcriptional regulator, cyclic AMP receptor protein
MPELRENEEILEKLRLMPALKGAGEHELEGILSLSRMEKYETGEVVIREGQYDNWIYFLISGKVAIQKAGETIGSLQSRGDIFGEMGIIDGSPRSASIVALEPAVALAMDASYIDRLKGQQRVAFQCVLYQAFAEILAIRLRLADDRLIKIRNEKTLLEREISRLRSESTQAVQEAV